MEFLKALFGNEALTYDGLVQALNEFNGNEENKDKQIKIANLGTGEYVSKSKHEALNDLLKGKDAELTTANGLIAELKKGTKGNEELQGKITAYESQVADLQKELKETKIKSAVKVGLLAAKCKDVDYVTYKLMETLKEKGETLEIDENENIKNWDDKLSGLQTQLPTQFEGGGEGDNGGFTPLDNKGLPKNFDNKAVTKEQFLAMGYNDRLKLKQENEQLYRQLAKN